MNFDFVAMNLTGFTFYSIYCTYGYFISDDQTGKVDLNDLLFAYHAIFATLLTLSQILFFPKKQNKVHAPTIIYLVAMWTFLIVWSVLVDVFMFSFRD
jgi:cystinosin